MIANDWILIGQWRCKSYDNHDRYHMCSIYHPLGTVSINFVGHILKISALNHSDQSSMTKCWLTRPGVTVPECVCGQMNTESKPEYGCKLRFILRAGLDS